MLATVKDKICYKLYYLDRKCPSQDGEVCQSIDNKDVVKCLYCAKVDKIANLTVISLEEFCKHIGI